MRTMGTPGDHRTRGRGAGARWLAAAVCSALLLGLAPAAPASAASASVEVIGAGDPVALAVQASRRRFPAGDSATSAVLARNDVFADALAGSGLQALGPLLLTSRTRLDAGTAAELRRALPSGATVHLLGGPAALSSGVERSVAALGLKVKRIEGDHRVATAAAVARVVSGGRTTTALLARADAWPDAIAGGAVAAHQRWPLVLTSRSRLDADAAKVLRDLGVTRTLVLGGPEALSDAVLRAVPGGRRIAGPDRYATAAAVAADRWPGATASVFAPGDGTDGWAWGLAVAGLAADQGAPLLYTAGRTVPFASAEVGGGCERSVARRVVVGRPSQTDAVASSLARCDIAKMIAQEIHALANAERARRGLTPLRWDDGLAKMAADWSKRMAAKGSLSHRSGLLAYPGVAGRFRSAGENVYSGDGGVRWYGNAGAAHSGWMRSDGHRRNLLQPAYTHVGVGVVCVGGRLWATQNLAGDGSRGSPRSGTPSRTPVVHDGDAGFSCG